MTKYQCLVFIHVLVSILDFIGKINVFDFLELGYGQQN